MSGLAALLAHRKEPGIYRWHGHFKDDDVRHTVEHAGWRFAHVDGWHGETKGDFLRAAGEALSFPDHYGQNFDALADCLGDVVAGDSEGWLLLWDGWGPLADALGVPAPNEPFPHLHDTNEFRAEFGLAPVGA